MQPNQLKFFRINGFLNKHLLQFRYLLLTHTNFLSTECCQYEQEIKLSNLTVIDIVRPGRQAYDRGIFSMSISSVTPVEWTPEILELRIQEKQSNYWSWWWGQETKPTIGLASNTRVVPKRILFCLTLIFKRGSQARLKSDPHKRLCFATDQFQSW